MRTIHTLRINSQKGFTVVEVAVVAPIAMLIILAVFAILTVLLQSSAAERVGAQNLYDVRTALTAIESDSSLSDIFLSSTDNNQSDPYAPTGGWSYKGSGDSSRVLILRSFATTTNAQSNERRPVFYTAKGCTPAALYYNTPLTYNTIYFVKDRTLYKRILINTSSPTCSPAYQQQTCPASSGCAVDDETILTDVSQFSVDYYSDSESDTKTDTYNDSLGDQKVAASNAANVTIGVTRRAYGQPLTSTSSLRVSKLITESTDN